MKGFEWLEPTSMEEAFRFLREYGDGAKIYAGGTALVKLMKKRLVHPSHLVNIKGLKDLHYIREDGEGLKIGGLATLREIELSPFVRQRFRAISEMAHMIGSVQIRNVGTLAGNLCFADPASDPAPLLIALEARLKIASAAGSRILPLEEFFTDFYETALSWDEIVEEIQVPFLPTRSGAVYLKHTMRVAFDLAVVGAAVKLEVDSKETVGTRPRIVLGGVASTPVRAKKSEELLRGKIIHDDLIRKVAAAASMEVDPIQDVRASTEYRREMVEVFVERGLHEAWERTKGGVL